MMRRRFFISTMQSEFIPSTQEYENILNYAISEGYQLPSNPQKRKQENFIIDLKTAGIWESLDLLYVFATDGDSHFARINWISPGQFTAEDRSGEGSPIFTANEGFRGATTSSDGYDGSIDTNWKPRTHAVNMEPNNASYFVHVHSALGSGIALGTQFNTSNGDDVTSRIHLTPRATSPTNKFFTCNSAAGQVDAGAGSGEVGFHHAYNPESNKQVLYVNGSHLHTDTITSTGLALPDLSLLLFRSNFTPGPGPIARYKLSIVGVGASLEGKEAALYNAWNTYFSSL